MSESPVNLETRPEVAEFVAAVREQLTDLAQAEREELLEGLEADVTELVNEHGVESLGDPVGYARDLRAAAGLPERRSVRSGKVTRTWSETMDGWRDGFLQVVNQPPLRGVWQVITGLQVAWWIVRAWVATMLCAAMVGSFGLGDTWWLPSSNPVLGAILLTAAVIASVAIGRGRIWPGTGGGFTRTVLVGLNACAALLAPDFARRGARPGLPATVWRLLRGELVRCWGPAT